MTTFNNLPSIFVPLVGLVFPAIAFETQFVKFGGLRMKGLVSTGWKGPVKFRMPTAENLVPIRLDIQFEGQRYKDAFTWNPSDPDNEVVIFAKRTVKDLKLPYAFVTQIAQSIQSQLSDFRAYEGQDMYTGEKIIPIKLDLRVNHTLIKDQFLWDLNNFESDPEEFARTLCKDLGVEDPEVGPAVAFAIREQLYEVKTLIVTLSYSLCISVYSIYVFYFEQECQTY
jgi:SWI/SNF-related matrix-associated actin-dependent regulator of chromatin subfamily B protein 1